MTIKEWKKEIAEKYQTHAHCVVNRNSFTDWGYAGTRPVLGYEISPFGGKYTVYSQKTFAELR